MIRNKANTTSQVIRNLLGDDGDMLSLYLTKPDRQEGEQVCELGNVKPRALQEEVELLLSSYSADLDEIETEIKIFIDMIEDTDQFISAHLDSVRNEIIKMSLFIEVGGLVMGFGAVVSGIFGMNLNNKIEVPSLLYLVLTQNHRKHHGPFSLSVDVSSSLCCFSSWDSHRSGSFMRKKCSSTVAGITSSRPTQAAPKASPS